MRTPLGRLLALVLALLVLVQGATARAAGAEPCCDGCVAHCAACVATSCAACPQPALASAAPVASPESQGQAKPMADLAGPPSGRPAEIWRPPRPAAA